MWYKRRSRNRINRRSTVYSFDAGGDGRAYRWAFQTVEMWFPIELHSVGSVHGGLPDAMRAHLRAHPHYLIVSDRRFDGSPITDDKVDSVVDSLDGCSVAFAGTHHMSPAGPFGAFTLAPDLGIAYLEHLVSSDPLPDDRNVARWITVPVHHFVNFLLRDHAEISTIVLPLSLGEPPFDGFIQNAVDDRYHLTRC